MGRQKGLFGVGTLSVVFAPLLKVLVHNFADKTVEEPFVRAAAVQSEGTPRAQTASNHQNISHQTSLWVRDSSACRGTPLWAVAQVTGAPDEPRAGSRPTQAHEDTQPGCKTEGCAQKSTQQRSANCPLATPISQGWATHLSR